MDYLGHPEETMFDFADINGNVVGGSPAWAILRVLTDSLSGG